MSFSKGFGKPQPSQINKLVEQTLNHCRKQNPEGLDRIFDKLPVEFNKKILAGVLADLDDDTDNLAWFCGYLAGEVNRSEDNGKPRHPISLLSKILIKYGMRPFEDFSPDPGCRLMILNAQKFEALPEDIQALVKGTFKIIERTGEEAKQINDALLKELMG